jgi:hypothetical protein
VFFYQSHFTDEETKAQRSLVACPSGHRGMISHVNLRSMNFILRIMSTPPHTHTLSKLEVFLAESRWAKFSLRKNTQTEEGERN